MTQNNSNQNVSDIVRQYIATYFSVPVETIKHETIAEDIDGWDSMANAEIIMGLEEDLQTELEVEDLLDLDNVGCMIEKFQKLASQS